MNLADHTSTGPSDLTREEYELIRRLVYSKSGINLGDEKMQLVRSRLGKRVRQGRFASYRHYIRHVMNDQTDEALWALLDAITTNTTHLFREMRHFDLLRTLLRQWVADKRWRAAHSTVRIWSAASSSGEEPYSIAMVAHDALREHPNLELKILATDLSVQMLSEARLGRYPACRVGTVPPQYRNRYLRNLPHDGEPHVEIVPELRRIVTFARFNLMLPTFPFRHGFDVVFCRNVMIYFDQATREALVNRIAGHLHPEGYLMIGHSESLNGIQHPLRYVEPTVYRNDTR